jgi:cytochrome c biogenesis protein CcmG, thiol:disulfide interchange protein DsbE
MQTMKELYSSGGLSIVAVNLDRQRADADRFLDRFRPSFDVRFDSRGQSAERFKIHTMPTSLVIDRHGVVRFTHVGFRPVEEALYEEQIRMLLAEP